MNKRRIGKSGLVVSDICLGTMTFGSSCDEREAFRIMDRAVAAGIDFFDMAEIYPVPPEWEYVYETEKIVGKWLQNQDRDSIIIATKFCGPGHGWFVPPVRSGRTSIDRHHIRKAIDASLKRLNTDYVDLYQTHWPDHEFPYESTLEALTELIDVGKVRYIGSSNENPWGTMKAIAVSQQYGFARYESVQNNFSLINRRFEDAMAEICRRETIGLLPYSPLGGGVLTGKYNDDRFPENARFTSYRDKGGERQKQQVTRFVNEKSLGTTRALVDLAQSLDLDVTTLAVAWSKQHDFVASTIVGANTASQLEASLAAADVELSDATMSQIDEITSRFPYPLG